MNQHHMKVIIGGILFLVVAMGIGRFSFTPLLPYMREAERLSVADGGLLASANYIGYLIGAMGAGFIVKHQKSLLGVSAWLCVLSVMGMGIFHPFTVWFILRFISGITGGLIFVLTSSMLMDYLAGHRLTQWSGYLFSGIGLGIALSGLIVPAFEKHFAWQGTWIGLSVVSSIFVIITFYCWRKLQAQSHERAQVEAEKVWTGFFPWLTIAYGLEGLGYIVTGTFLVDMLHGMPTLRSYADYSWVVAGIGAIPAAPIWMTLMTKFKPIQMIAIAYILQIIGILLPVISPTLFGAMISAFLFGMTFVGIVTMTTSYGRQLYPTKSASVVSILTVYYAVGQIIGPIVAGKLVAYFGGYNAALLFAGSIVTLGLIIMLIGKWKTPISSSVKQLQSATNIAEEISDSKW